MPHPGSPIVRAPRRAVLALLLCATLAGIAGCAAPTASPPAATADAPVAGDIPDDQKYVTVSGESGTFSLQVPEGWASSTSTVGTVYSDKLNSITVSRSAAETAPTQASFTAGVASFTAPFTNPGPPQVATVTRTGGDAILVTFEADSPKDTVTGTVHRDTVEAYVFWRNGTEVVLFLEGPTSADNVDPWRIVTDSFRWA